MLTPMYDWKNEGTASRRISWGLGRLFLVLAALLSGHPVRANGQIITLTPTSSAGLDQALTVVMTPRGFLVRTLNIKEGRVVLLIQNRSRIPNLTLTVSQVGQAAAFTSSHTATHGDNVFNFTILPGAYQITVAERPLWNLAINVVQK